MVMVCKDTVFEEVSRTTGYAGCKRVASGDAGGYQRLFVTDASREMLERFYVEGCQDVLDALLRTGMVCHVSPATLVEGVSSEDFCLELSVSDLCNDCMLSGCKDLIESYLVNSILGKWYVMTNEASGVEAATVSQRRVLDELVGLMYWRGRPERPKLA